MENKFEAAFSTLRRAFWVHSGLCLAALLIAFSPSESEIYANAVTELRTLGGLSVAQDQVIESIHAEMADSHGDRLKKHLSQAAQRHQFSWDPGVLEQLQYASLAAGPASIDFDGSVDSLLRAAGEVTERQPYRVRIPDPSRLEEELGQELATSKLASAGTPARILSIVINCDGEEPRCAVVAKADDAKMIEMSPPALQLELAVSAWDVVERYAELDDLEAALSLLSTAAVADEVLDQSRLEAISTLTRRQVEAQQSFSAFGTVFRGRMAVAMAPLILAAAAMFYLTALVALDRLRHTPDDIATGFVAPLFYGWNGFLVRSVLLLVVPLLAQLGLVAEAFRANSIFPTLGISLCAGIHLAACGISFHKSSRLSGCGRSEDCP